MGLIHPLTLSGLSLNTISSTQLCSQRSDPVGPRSDSEGSPLFPASSPSWSRPANTERGENYRNRLNILNRSCLLPTLCFHILSWCDTFLIIIYTCNKIRGVTRSLKNPHTFLSFCAVTPKDIIITSGRGRGVTLQSSRIRTLSVKAIPHQLKHDVQTSAILVYAQDHDPKFQRKAILLCQSEVGTHNSLNRFNQIRKLGQLPHLAETM